MNNSYFDSTIRNVYECYSPIYPKTPPAEVTL